MFNFKELRQRWEAEETAIGKKLKYYIGYMFMVAGYVTMHVQDITSIFMNAGVVVPVWVPKVFLACGFIGYIGGKLTKKDEGQQIKNP
jgi:hypothetical protein